MWRVSVNDNGSVMTWGLVAGMKEKLGSSFAKKTRKKIWGNPKDQ